MIIALSVCYVAFAIRRLITYLHLFQQEEYDGIRFLRLVFIRRWFDLRATAIFIVISMLSVLNSIPSSVFYTASSATFVLLALIEKDPRKSAKKPLIMTTRATRILSLAAVNSIVLSIAMTRLIDSFWPWIFLIQIVPLLLVLANYMLMPFQARIQRRYWSEAHSKLLSIKPKTIGVTGSFGKTTVKHILAHILEMQAPTLMTPGSINTVMGIARVIREQLHAGHKFFVCEMGAYGPGSISKLTALVPPDIGIITSIGHAHFERFKALDTVAKTKFELARSVVERSGSFVVAESVLKHPSASAFAADHRVNMIVVGNGESCDARIVKTAQDVRGIEADLMWRGNSYTLRAPLFGQHQAMNIALSFVAACALGVSEEDAVIALSSVAQIRHRLEVSRDPGGWVKIDDAYNSNPVGFESALRVLDLFHHDGGRRILITPGMVELGASHDEQHEKIGHVAAAYADVLVAIMPERILTLISAFKAGNQNGVVKTFANYAEADAWLNINVNALDVVLLENDLPDVYEKILKL